MKMADTRPRGTNPDYDFTSNLGTLPASGITIVDIGGGHGHALDTIIKNHPNLPGRLVLQDLPDTIKQIKDDQYRKISFEPTVHNFFEPQPPSMQPRWFYLRHILHDWSDDACLKILSNLRGAVTGSTNSSILVQELVLPAVGAAQFDTLLDINMMNLGGMERSEAQWKELIDKAGMEIKGITIAKMGNRGVIEVGLKDPQGAKAKM